MNAIPDPHKQGFKFSQLLYDTRYRSMTIQVVSLIALLLFFGWLISNTAANLATLGKPIQFKFLGEPSNYDINQRLLDYTSRDTHLRAGLMGLLNTLVLAFMGCITATVLGVAIGVMRLSKNWLVARVMTLYIEMFRNIPVLLWIIIVFSIMIETMPRPNQFRSGEASMKLLDSVAITNRGVYIPEPLFSNSTAGIMAASDNDTAAWYSPAGQRRGVYLGVTGLAYTPNKTERDLLYRNSISPIANIPGQGILLYGDKTHMARPSAFDRINVRRLFLVIERAIAIAARNVMFEFNDEFTRAEFVNIIEPFLREIQGRRGITDFRVVADETNNPPAVIDRNEFVCSIFIKPARSINFVTLNFVAVRTGVDFEEVVGSV